MTGPAGPPEVTVLRPGRPSALVWALVSAAVIALSVWLVADTGGHPLAVVLLVACLVVPAPLVAQLVVPDAFAWRLDEHGLHVRRLHRRMTAPWDEVRYARIVLVGGDPALELRLEPGRRGASDPQRRDGRAVHTLRLPLGADVDALHRALAHHLGALHEDDSPVSRHPPSGHP